jgi:hypothetical protein
MAHPRVHVSPSRPFTLTDAMILIAATAIGLCAERTRTSYLQLDTQFALSNSEFWLDFACSLALSLTLALIPLRLLQPRPAWRRLRRQPGLVVSLTSVLVVALWCLSRAPSVLRASWRSIPWLKEAALADAFDTTFWPYFHGPAVAVAWMVLALSGRWCPEASWIDRLGRALGITWIGLFVASSILEFWK